MVIQDDGDLIKGLGFVCLYAAYLEEAIDECVEAFREVCQPPRPKAPASIKLDFCVEQARHQGVSSMIAECLDRAKSLLEKRNDVVHGRIYAQVRGPDLRKSGRLGVRNRDITSAELYELATELDHAVRLISQAAEFYIPDAIRNKICTDKA